MHWPEAFDWRVSGSRRIPPLRSRVSGPKGLIFKVYSLGFTSKI